MSWNPTTANLASAALVAVVGVYTLYAARRTHLPWSRWRVLTMLTLRVLLLASLAAWCLDLRVAYRRHTRRVELVAVEDRSISLSAQGHQTVNGWLARAKAAGEKNGWSFKSVGFGGDLRGGSALAEALDEARSLYSGGGEKRMLVVSDGRWTTRDPADQAGRMRAEGVRVFAVPAEPDASQAMIAGIAAPPSAWRNVPAAVDVELRSPVAQACRLTLTVDGQRTESRDVQAGAGLTSVSLSVSLDKDGPHRIDVQAEFPQQAPGSEELRRAVVLVDVPLAPRVVVVSDLPAGQNLLESALTAGGMQARLCKPDALPAQWACDALVLDNVAADALTEPRMKAAERFVHGGGAIVFAGGRKSFGAGGYLGSPLEPVFPVLLIPRKEYPPYALAIVLDNSWSMNEGVAANVGKINLAKEIAIASMEGLNKGDWLTMVSFDSEYHNIINPTKVADLEPAKYEASRIGAFGMTNIRGGLQEAAKILKAIDAPYKHILLISDGHQTETGTDYSGLLAILDRDKVTLSTIGVGRDPEAKLLNTLAYSGKGRYYHAKSISEIPATVLQEARNMQDSLIVEAALTIKKLANDAALEGMDAAAMPPLTGYNRSRARTHAWTPVVVAPRNDPLLARMRYGDGQSLAFLSSSGGSWAKAWVEGRPAQYAAFWKQAVASVLPSPSRPLAPCVTYAFEGRPGLARPAPVFTIDLQADAKAEGMRASNSGMEPLAVPAVTGGAETMAWPVSAGDARSILVTEKGKANRAFSWSLCYGREFDDPARGVETLRRLCRDADGLWAPTAEQVFAPGQAVVDATLPTGVWLAIACFLLVADLLVRRMPAVTAVLRRIT